MNPFSSQLQTTREMTRKLQNHGFYNQQTEVPVALPSTGLPFRYPNMEKPDNTLTTFPIPVPRKRSRDFITETTGLPVLQKTKLPSQPSILDQELIFLLKSHQSEMDLLITQHSERMRMELQEERLRQSRTVITRIHESVRRKVKEKEEEIQRAAKLNSELQERVKSLCLENQIFRDLAHTNEATAYNLHNDLEQLLAHVSDDQRYHNAVESSCQSSNNPREEEEVSGGNGNRKENGNGNGNDGVWGKRKCRLCGEKESIVVLLPCRHLCVCTLCGSTVHHCPVCHSRINASVHVNYS